ncbi:hypothetical protein RJ640_016512 [Escallonia rubra]|uniref:Phytocyanin domain-containing protein n=1 Tax=Escallonia rubra TaxID=112253 RepID=A0AA88RLF5_9ASTE|nr:hypothetical protein RJ640_016512 [Escallonia rubra]
MAFRGTHLLVLLSVTASMLAIAMANRNFTNWNSGFNYTDWAFKHHKCPQSSNKIVVGGSQNWHFGVDYMDWARKNGPFYLNDTIVFKYDAPTATRAHSVYLLKNFRSFLTCDLTGATKVADTTQGGGEGFEFVLKNWQPHYFACGEGNGFHCSNGTMSLTGHDDSFLNIHLSRENACCELLMAEQGASFAPTLTLWV